MTVAEAAHHLGVSPDTVRRRMKNGELESRKDQRPQGFVWRVRPPGKAAPTEAPAPNGTASEDVRLAVALAQVGELRQTVGILTGELEARREVSALHILLQRAQAQLPPPQHVGGTDADTPVDTPVETPVPRMRRPWWKRWGA